MVFAHALQDLDVPNESQHQGVWSQVWKPGGVDIQFWHNATCSDQSKERSLTAFNWERRHSPSQIPNWAWGVAYYSDYIEGYEIPSGAPKDFDWARLQQAWWDGRYGTQGSRTTVRAVLGRYTEPS